MSCDYNKEKLEAYAVGFLDKKDQQDVTDHIQSCSSCRADLAGHKQAARILKDAFDEEPPSWLPQKTMSLLKNKSKRLFPSWFTLGIPALVGTAAIMLFIFIEPGFHRPPIAPSNTARLSETAGAHAPAVQQNDMNTVPKSSPTASQNAFSALPGSIADVLNINLENPIYNRSIYDNLGVATEIAKLLL